MLSYAIQHAMPPVGGKWRTECMFAYSAVCGIQREADFDFNEMKVLENDVNLNIIRSYEHLQLTYKEVNEW